MTIYGNRIALIIVIIIDIGPERSTIMEESKKLTNEAGAPVAENEHSLTTGVRGPVALQDVWLLEKLAHFDREVIPERRMHNPAGH